MMEVDSLKRWLIDQEYERAPLSKKQKGNFHNLLQQAAQSIACDVNLEPLRERFRLQIMKNVIPQFSRYTRFFPPDMVSLYQQLVQMAFQNIAQSQDSYTFSFYPEKMALQAAVYELAYPKVEIIANIINRV